MPWGWAPGAGRRFLIKDALGPQSRYVQQAADIDEETLKKAAQTSPGALYFRAENTKGLEEIYATIDQMEKTEKDIRSFKDYNDFDDPCIPGFWPRP